MKLYVLLRNKMIMFTRHSRKFLYRLRGNIVLGHGVIIEGAIDTPWNSGSIKIGDNTSIRKWVCLRPYGGSIEIGKNCTINSFCHISGNGNVTIGNNVLIATQCVIVSANHNFDDVNMPISLQGEVRKEIVIEDDCWLGAGVKVLAGVTIHRGSVVGAGSVVTHDIPEYSIAVGVPAKVIKRRTEYE